MRSVTHVLAVVALLAVTAAPAAAEPWQWPLEDHRIDRAFDLPESDYGPGHRGVDLPGRIGQVVRSVAAGRVSFVGRVAGIATITIDHGTERSTYQPVEASVRVGDAVDAGQPIGRLLGGHRSCRRTCLNLGRLRGDAYLDPADLLGGPGAYRLISPDGPAPEPPSVGAGGLPLDGPITSFFGMRVHPVTGVRKLHDGVDIGASCATPVPVVASGVVIGSATLPGYGRQVEVRHGDGTRTSYSHLSSRAVVEGDRVAAGRIVGRVGSTGLSTGCHLHFMRIVDGRPVDPLA